MLDAFEIWKRSAGSGIYRFALESFLLHARNLLNTFYEPRPLAQMGDDDLLARDFFIPPANWERVRPASVPPTLSSVRERLNKLLAHLTYSRVGYADNDDPSWRWPCAEMARELKELIEVFKKNLPEENRRFFGDLLDNP